MNNNPYGSDLRNEFSKPAQQPTSIAIAASILGLIAIGVCIYSPLFGSLLATIFCAAFTANLAWTILAKKSQVTLESVPADTGTAVMLIFGLLIQAFVAVLIIIDLIPHSN